MDASKSSSRDTQGNDAGPNSPRQKDRTSSATKKSRKTTKLTAESAETPAPLKKNAKVIDKIIFAIRSLRSGPKGSSRAALSKYLQTELDYDNPSAFKLALKKGVSNGTLVQEGQSFRVAADPRMQVEQEEEEEALQIDNVKDGSGDKEASVGSNVTVSYVGKLDDGTVFDRASSFTFLLGGGDVIKGWDRGVVGMKEGGKRKLVVPPKLGYGKRGCKPDIPPNATLHFVITMKKIAV